MIPSHVIALTEKLDPILPDEFARVVLSGCLRVAWDVANPIRANLFAAGLRELGGYVLHLSAPEEQVRKCRWYQAQLAKKIASTKGKTREELDKITRRDRMIYATQGGLDDSTIASLGVNVSDVHKNLVRVFDDLNKFTHVRPGSIISDASEVAIFMARGLEAFIAFYAMLSECRETIAEAISDAANDETVTAMTETAIQELDELSTHTLVDEVIVDDINVSSIEADEIKFDATGTVYVTLNYGSGSDFRRGDGASMSDSYPFGIEFRAPTSDLKRISAGSPRVNNDSFFE